MPLLWLLTSGPRLVMRWAFWAATFLLMRPGGWAVVVAAVLIWAKTRP